MDPLIQSAIDAAKEGDKKKAADLIRKALEAKPNDIDALLALVTITDEDAQKRRVLNRVLSLDPTNKAAREMLLEMDRAEIQSRRSQMATAPASPTQTTADDFLKKPQIFKLSQTGLILLFVFTSISCCGTLWFAAINNMTVGFAFLGIALLLALAALTASSKVEVSETGIQTSSYIRSAEIKWNEIASITANPWKGILELRSDVGDVVNISTQTKGYRDILDILRLKRPDLFSQVSPAPVQSTNTATKSDVLEPVLSNPMISAHEPITPQPAVPFHEKTNVQQEAAVQEKASIPVAQQLTDVPKERTVTFALPLFWRLFMYSVPIFLGVLGLLIAVQNVLYSLPFLGLALILGLIAMAFSPKVQITETGVRTYGMFDTTEAQWNELVQMKSNPMKRRLELSKANGEMVGVSTQVSGYPRIVEILRQKRPDLFTAASPSAQPTAFGISTEGTVAPNREPTFTGVRTFKKNWFAQYGVFLLMSPFCLFGVGLLATYEDKFVGVGIGGVGVFFIVMSLFSVHQVKVEPNKISTESFFTQKEYAANQIKEIRMKTVRSRHGIATNLVSIEPVEGGAISLGGFPDGDEVIYGVLQDWWETYKNR
jgi:hypothetical protein